MVNCDNCETVAVYTIDDRGAATQHFCKEHLPWFYKKRAGIGALTLANQAVAEPVVEAPKPKPRKKTAANKA